MKYRSLSKNLGVLCAFLAVACILATVAIVSNSSRANAAPITDFTAGNIIDDSIFYNKNSMTVTQIQSFLDTLIPNCDVWGTQASGYGGLTNAQYAQQVKGWPGPPYVCLNKYYENPNNNETSYEKGGGAFAGGISAAQIIYNAAQTYNISPQVLLVMLKKESLGPLTADSWPLKSQYKYSMGYACPDSGPGYSANCDASKAGFYKQMMLAAWQLNYYKEHPNDYRYKLGWNNIQYSTEPSCGTKSVYIENMATLSLYIYTPYTPNNGALAAYPGTASCGAYGNRNFFAYFKEWFGDPRLAVTGVMATSYNANTWLGKPLINQVCTLRDGGCYQLFANGAIYWTSATGAQIVRGGIKDKWVSAGFENGMFGYPTTGELIASDGSVYQTFQGGMINWTSASGGRGFATGIFNAWNQSGGEKGFSGKPTIDSICNLKDGGCYQLFTRGAIYWSPATGAQVIHGGIKDKWVGVGFENGSLGYPTSGETAFSKGVYQSFQGGKIYWSNDLGAIKFSNELYGTWTAYGAESGFLGKPTTDSLCGLKNNGCYQLFKNGALYWTSATGTQIIFGGIKEKWVSLGLENGKLGYPTSGEIPTSGGVYQTFQGGTINWTASAGASVVYN